MLTFLRLAPLLLSGIAHAAVVLSVDVNDAIDTSSDTAPGFSTYLLSDNTLSVSGFSVDLNPSSGAALDDLHRTTPATGGALTLGALYRDSVFAAGDNTANFYRVGLDTVIGGLTAGKKYTLTVWGYDSGSTGARVSDWSVLGLGGVQWAANNFTFDGATPPASDTANRFAVTAYADATGTLILRGRPGQQSATASVYLNGFTVDELATPAITSVPILAVDFGERELPSAPNVQTDFQEFLLTGAFTGTGATANPQSTASVRTFGAQTVTLLPVGTTVDDRLRSVPGNSGAFTESPILRDFVFATTSGGMDVTVAGLTAGTAYLVEVWSFDGGSTAAPQPRTSDWTVNGATLWDDYTFNGNNAPATNNDYKMVGAFAANGSGQIVISGRVVVNTPAVFLNALRISSLVPAAVVDFGHPVINEFAADNANGIMDEDGATSDWIEIWNTTAASLNLAGWTLTGNGALQAPVTWTFPAGVSVPAQGFLRVWASGKNRTVSGANLHTNFTLEKSAGSYLALAQPGGAIVSSFSNLPAQRANVSYGRYGTVEPQTIGYFQAPTPLAQNAVAPVPGFVNDTTFDINRGFFTTAQTVHITCVTPGATIYYTTDGSEPTTASSVVTAGGVAVTTTTVLRAKAFAPPLAPSNTDTQTYIFRADTQNQPAAPAGWPATWGTDSQVATNNGGNGTVPADYEMDPNVVTTTLPNYGVTDGLNALPVLSVAMNPSDFHSVGSGIYTNPRSVGDLWEKACSFELLELDGSNTHINCGIRVHGNSSRTPFRMQKHSFRLAFRSQYGDGKLGYKLFDDTTVKQFDRLVLHAFFTDGFGLVSWTESRYRPHTAVSFRDPFLKKTFGEMGHQSVSGRYVHLYINGLYWGLYELAERVDENWCADHLGGLPADWDIIAPDTTLNTATAQLKAGNLTEWNNLIALVTTPDLSMQANYDAVAAKVDLTNFADYYLLHIHGDAEDWPHHNGFAIRNRLVPGSKWQFVAWDQEIAFDPLVLVDRLSVGAPNTGTASNVPLTMGVLFQKLRVNSEFRLLLADRAHRHMHNGGRLSLAAEQTRWQSFIDLLDKPIVAESARWGDTADATPYGNAVVAGNETLKRETHWLPQVNLVRDSHLPMLHNTANSNATITELRSQSPKFYPAIEPPNFAQFGGNVPSNYALTITAATGQIYYTTNGSDPRVAYTGAIAGSLYSGSVPLTQTAVVKARSFDGTEWSALTAATFIVGTAASSANLAVTELNYNPAATDEEFIELMNISASIIDLTGVHFEGITFTFADGTLLNPGERICITRDVTAFTTRYGNGPRVVGPYAGALDNTGEEIAVIAANTDDIVRFIYNDKGPWPVASDGTGRSLVLRRVGVVQNLSDGANWRSSTANGGNPGGGDTVAFSGTPLVDADGDGYVRLFEYLLAGDDSVAGDLTAPIAGVETLIVSGIPAQYLTLTARTRAAADDATLGGEFSSNLTLPWQSAVYVGETVNFDGTVSRKWRAPVPHSGAQQFVRLRGAL